jgi:hypothetical protein
MKTRLVTLDDLPQIMEIERESFSALGEDAMASEETMRDRIARCNSDPPGWFWAAGETHLHGYVLLMPTHLLPEECTSWEAATGGGTLSTFDPTGETIFGVSMGARQSASPAAFYMLVHRAMVLFVSTGKKRLMLCSRIPGLRAAREKTGMTGDQYIKLNDRKGRPRDPLLNKFHSAFGVGAYAFMPDGFPIDVESDGHSALILVEDPFVSLTRCIEQTYAVSGQK